MPHAAVALQRIASVECQFFSKLKPIFAMSNAFQFNNIAASKKNRVFKWSLTIISPFERRLYPVGQFLNQSGYLTRWMVAPTSRSVICQLGSIWQKLKELQKITENSANSLNPSCG